MWFYFPLGIERYRYMKNKNSNGEINRKKKTVGDYIRMLVMLIAIGVFVYSGSQLIKIFLEYKQGTDEYKKLTQYVSMSITEDLDIDAGYSEDEVNAKTDGTKMTESPVDFKALKEINEDVVGWIDVKAIDIINYPVVYGEDNDYYLHHTFQRTLNGAGSIFIDYTNKPDFTDQNTFIYGHNMKNKSMFGDLKDFHKKETFEKSPYIWVYTPTASYKYQIFSYHVAGIETNSFQNMFQTTEEFENYIDMVQRASEYATGVEVTKDDKIITLSTCTNDDTTRFLVHAKLIKTIQHQESK
jgi:sortase B